ncbi:hypothetical protein [Pseudomonas sp. MWU12-2323]|uniref:hypothetical protein n=1 Tax=Pseudomonas sp. MWU12-2323 TaxID=2651296 RepID=UPI0015B59C4C|nr:hypothetical protein [Pseudomonas sp. MWU12-2323]
MNRRPPVATMLSSTTEQTVWKVQWPSTMFKQGGTYRAIVRHADAVLLIETWVKAKPVAVRVFTKISPVVLAAIAVAQVK